MIYFFDYRHINKGKIGISFDPERLAESSLSVLNNLQENHNVNFRTDGHYSFDDCLPTGIEIVLDRPVVHLEAIKADQPWEKGISWATMLMDEGKYKCWYVCVLNKDEVTYASDDGRLMELSGSALCYAESTDGLRWMKPKLGLFAFNNSKENNIVCSKGGAASVFIDRSAPAEERYKSFDFAEIKHAALKYGLEKYALFPMTSPDGFHWTVHEQPAYFHFADTYNIAAYDEEARKYIGFFRGHEEGMRSINRSETTNFREWPVGDAIMYAGPMESPYIDYYTPGFTVHPDDSRIKFLFPSIYDHNTDQLYTRAAVSSNTTGFNWISTEPIVGADQLGPYKYGMNWACPDLLRLPDGSLALPFGCTQWTHEETFYRLYYEKYPVNKDTFGLAVWEKDRMCAVEAKEFGDFYVKRIVLNKEECIINAVTGPRGYIKMELADTRGQPMDGFAFEHFDTISGDVYQYRCTWKGKQTASLQGKSVRIHIQMRNAKIYSIDV